MKVLVIGGGGREHAIVWKLAQSPLVDKIFCAPGNPGIAELAECINIETDDIEGLKKFALENKIDLTIVGPENPLCMGVVDGFQSAGLRIFGPTRVAASLEGSKVFAKILMREYGIPTAQFRVFNNFFNAAAYAEIMKYPTVIKADGLAGGKGVVVCQNANEAYEALYRIMEKKDFGEAGKEIIIEECLIGEEVSYIVMVDSRGHVIPFASSQDHKRVKDGDAGPNTGGMGAYSPAPIITPELEEKILQRIIYPTLEAMEDKEHPFCGFLYAGLMIVDGEPYVLEFNIRLGDPEAQPILMRMKSDLIELILAALEGSLNKYEIEWYDNPAVCVVMAAEGYPGTPRKGDVIYGLPEAGKTGAVIFHAGTVRNETTRSILTAGGRVLGITALGKDIKTAKKNAYKAVEEIFFYGMHYRKDIADRAINRK